MCCSSASVIRVSIEALKKRAEIKGEEYLKESMESGTVIGGMLCLRDSKYLALRFKYDPGVTGLGDLIAVATSLFGVKPCHGCLQRQVTLNEKTTD